MPAAPAPHGGTATRAAQRHARTRRNLLLALVALGVMWAALATSGGTYAFWSTGQTLEGGSISTGTAGLEARWSTEDDASVWQNLLPGETAGRSLQVRNTGDVPLSLSLDGSVSTPGLEVALADETCAADAAPAGSTPIVEPGADATLCVLVTATADLAPGTDPTITLTIDGRQLS